MLSKYLQKSKNVSGWLLLLLFFADALGWNENSDYKLHQKSPENLSFIKACSYQFKFEIKDIILDK